MSQWGECSEAALRCTRFTAKLCLTGSVTLVHGNLEVRIFGFEIVGRVRHASQHRH